MACWTAAHVSITVLLMVYICMGSCGRIDTHHHILPPDYLVYCQQEGLSTTSDIPLPDWTPELSLAYMDKFDIAGAILSLSSPGVPFGDLAKARSMARQVNEYTAKIASQHPDRFGFFAFLPMPDLNASIDEARYALDTLKADGVVLLGNARGRYFSEKEFHPLLEELNKRKTVIFEHPNYLPGPQVPGLPPFAADFLLDTVRAATLFVTTGAAEKYQDLRLILAHAGGFVPYVADRISMAAAAISKGGLAGADVSDSTVELLKRFYVDTALSASPYSFPSLLAFTEPSHITFGSDFPFAPDAVGAYYSGQLDKQFANDAAALTLINSGTASDLFPRFSKQCKLKDEL